MYNAYVTRIKNVRKHSNADRLNVGTCFGNQVIVSLETKEGDLGVYFPTDGQLGLEYATENNLIIKKDELGNNIGGYLDPEKRNIRTMKLRGEISDGLFMPIKSFEKFTDITKLKEGELISVLNGVEICKKYIPRKSGSGKSGEINRVREKKEKLIKFPNFHEHIDTSQLAYNLNRFNVGDICYITLKLHGTSARTGHFLKEEKIFHKGIKLFLDKMLKRKQYHINKEWSVVSGTRRVVLEDFSKPAYYSDNNFRKVWHDLLNGKLKKGECVYYEIVGYQSENSPIMTTVSNKSTNDKEFVKKYGENTTYSYGCKNGESDIYVYRMSITNEDGVEIDYPWDLVKIRCEQMGIKHVPEFERFVFTTEKDLMERVEKYYDGVDPIGLTHIREGVVVRIEGKEKFTAFKHKNIYFRILEGIIKNDATNPDVEEGQDLIEKDN